MFATRELLRRHTILHEPSHRRSVVSCDACRANKTKCSGGTPCLLCARRGINCTFQSGPNGASTTQRPTAANVSPSEKAGNDDHDEPALPASSRPKNLLAENGRRAKGDILPKSVKFFQNLTIVPSTPVPTSEFHPLSPGIQAMYDLLVAESPSLEGAAQGSYGLEEGVTKYLKTYFKNFHLRWPILHAPTFDIIIASLPLAASVCVIGAFQSSAIWTERFYALKVHEILLDRLLHNLVRILYSFVFNSQLTFYRLTQNQRSESRHGQSNFFRRFS
jgi:hypothetical protein